MVVEHEAAALRTGFAPVADRPLFCVRRGKVPYTSSGAPLTGSYAAPDLPNKLMSLDDALALAARGFDGVGIAFYPGCGVVGLDVDHCIGSDGALRASEVQRQAIALFMGHSFLEMSMSGTGLHAFALGDAETVKANGVLELFGDRNFIALTGKRGEGVVG